MSNIYDGAFLRKELTDEKTVLNSPLWKKVLQIQKKEYILPYLSLILLRSNSIKDIFFLYLIKEVLHEI